MLSIYSVFDFGWSLFSQLFSPPSTINSQCWIAINPDKSAHKSDGVTHDIDIVKCYNITKHMYVHVHNNAHEQTPC